MLEEGWSRAWVAATGLLGTLPPVCGARTEFWIIGLVVSIAFILLGMAYDPDFPRLVEG